MGEPPRLGAGVRAIDTTAQHMSHSAQQRRVAAIDLGKVRVGIALSDELGMLAHPRPHLDGRDRARLLRALGDLAQREGIAHFLVGLPLALGGTAGVAAGRAARFCQQLSNATGLPVELVDERLTTVEAERRLQAAGMKRAERAARVDSEAAAIMLQQWLDGRRAHASGPGETDGPPR